MKPALHKVLKILKYLVIILVLLFFILVTVVNLPVVHRIITQKANEILASKEIPAHLGSFSLLISGKIGIADVLILSPENDTIIYAGNAKVNVNPLALLSNKIDIRSISLDQVVVDLKSDEKTGELNILSVFSGESEKPEAEPEQTQKKESKPWEISLNEAKLENISFKYTDQPGGIKIVQRLKKSHWVFSEFSLLKKTIIAGKITLEGSDGKTAIWATKKQEEKSDSEPVTWKFSLNKLDIRDLNYVFDQPESKSRIKVKLKKGELSLKNIDLAEQKIEIGRIELEQPGLEYSSAGTSPEANLQNNETSYKIALPVLPWTVSSEKISVSGGIFNLTDSTGRTNETTKKWFPVKNIELLVDKVLITPESYDLSIKNLSAEIGESISLNTGTLLFESDSTGRINLNVGLKVAEENNRTTKWFAKNKEISINTKINGQIDNVLQISGFELKGSSGLDFSLNGVVTGLSDYQSAVCDINFKTKTITHDQLTAFLATFGFKYQLPVFDPFFLNGNISNTLQHPFLSLDLMSKSGNISLTGNYNIAQKEVGIKGGFTDLKLSQIFGETAPETITGKVDLYEKLNNTGFPSGTAQIFIDSVLYRGKNTKKISLTVKSEKKQADYFFTASDTSLTCNLFGNVKTELSGFRGEIKGNLDCNPYDLNFISKPLAIKGELESSFRFSKTNSVTDLKINKLQVYNKSKNIDLGKLTFSFSANDSSVFAKLNSEILQADFKSFATLPEFQKAFLSASPETAFNLDSSNFINLAEIGRLASFKLDAMLNYHPLFGLFYPDTVLNFSNVKMVVEKKETDGLVRANIESEKIKYNQIEVNQPVIEASIEADRIKADLRTGKIDISALQFGSSYLKAEILPSEFNAKLNITGTEGEILYGIDLKAQKTDDEIQLISSPDWIINAKKWTLSPEQILSWNQANRKLRTNVNIFSDKMQIGFSNDQSDNFLVTLKDVVLDSIIPHEISGYLPLGVVNAQIKYKSTIPDLLSFDLNFSNISWQNLKLNHILADGNITSDSTGILDGSLKLNINDSASVSLLMGKNKLKKGELLKGSFETFPVKLLQPFINDYIDNLSGTTSGDIIFKEDKKQVLFDGNIYAKDVAMQIIPLKASFSIPDNKLQIKNSQLIFDKFTIFDSQNKPMTLNGDISFSDIEKMGVDLLVKTDNIKLMNTTEKDNPGFFGSVVVNSGISIRGSLFSPEIRGKIELTNGTDITYQMVQDLSVEANQTDVVFAEIDHSMNVIYPESLEVKKTTQMPNIQTTINIDPKSIFKVKIADIYNVDISISGNGSLNYSMLPNNTMSLNGIYEIKNGDCILKITGWPRKDFFITPGSSFRWNGPIENPELNLEATSKVRGSYLNPIDNKNRTVDFIVSMRLENTLSKLGIIFNIKSEDQYISSVINSLSEDELMRQAVNLLLFETIDLPGIQSSSNYMASQISSFWESQLNALTKTSFKKTDLSFGIDTYDENSAAGKQEKTSFTYQMERKFMNDRATVKLSGKLNDYEESGYQTNSLFENFIFEYALDTLDSKFIKLYQRKDYEDMLEGEVIKYGVGFLYRKNYDRMKDIWQRKKTKKQTADKKDK